MSHGIVTLVAPVVARQSEFLDMAAEFGHDHIDGGAMGSQSVDDLRDPSTYAAWVGMLLRNEEGEDLPEGFVPSTSRWVDEDGELVGFLSLRHQLNDFLLREGGHIGYAVRPTARGRGIATAATGLALTEAWQRGLERVLITCDDDNAASATVIERNGGVLEDVRDGIRRYWVEPQAPSAR